MKLMRGGGDPVSVTINILSNNSTSTCFSFNKAPDSQTGGFSQIVSPLKTSFVRRFSPG